MKSRYLYSTILLIAVVGTAYSLWQAVHVSTTQITPEVCTGEALLCPDGSGVGRQGATCTFTPCPQQPYFVGTLTQQGDAYRLIIPAPIGTGAVTYALPVIFPAQSDVSHMLGNRIEVVGTFTEGSTFEVASSTLLPQTVGGEYTRTVSVGESAVIDGVRITLHEIIADNRCPIDVQCIEGGAITARVTLESDTDQETFTMPSDEVPHPFDTHTVAITAVAPEARSTQPIDPLEYEVTFTVAPLAP